MEILIASCGFLQVSTLGMIDVEFSCEILTGVVGKVVDEFETKIVC